jgi:prophage regulatory protein
MRTAMQIPISKDVGVERYLREKQLLEHYLPFSGSTLWRKVRSGTFPAPVKLGPAITAWREREVASWLNDQLEAQRR